MSPEGQVYGAFEGCQLTEPWPCVGSGSAHQAFLGDDIPPGREASWPYKAACGHLLEKLRALTPTRPTGTRVWPGLGWGGACWSLGAVMVHSHS
jgi:hypothetical protein